MGLLDNRKKKRSNIYKFSFHNELSQFCPFLFKNRELNLFILSCNYLSLGQFELARSSIHQLNIVNSRRVRSLLSSIIHNGPPPEWQFSASVPTSAHLVLACILEYKILFKDEREVEKSMIRRTEFDLLISGVLMENHYISYKSIRILRQCFNLFSSICNGELGTITIPELNLIPKMIQLPPYLSRIPSFSTKKCTFSDSLSIFYREINSFSEILILELNSFSYSDILVHVVDAFVINCIKLRKLHFEFFQVDSIACDSLINASVGLQWIILRNCFSTIKLLIENNGNITINRLMDTIVNGIKVLKLELIFEKCDSDLLISMDDNCINFGSIYKFDIEERRPEDGISAFIIIFSILNLFCKFDLEKNIIVEFLSNKKEILNKFEEMCNDCAIKSIVISNIEDLFKYDSFREIDFFDDISNYISIIKLNNRTNHDFVGQILDSNNGSTVITKILWMFDNIIFKRYFGTGVPEGIFLLGNCKEVNSDDMLRNINDQKSQIYLFNEKPSFWCEYLRYLGVTRNKFEELPIINFTNLLNFMNNLNNNTKLFEMLDKINLCFPKYRGLNIFLNLNGDPEFNWMVLKNLWLPYRSSGNKCGESTINEILANKLDTSSRILAISLFISRIENEINRKNGFERSEVAKEIIIRLKKRNSIINYFYNLSYRPKFSNLNWESIEVYISKIISLPLIENDDILLLTKERDCIKSYLLHEKVFNSMINERNNNFGLLMQKISYEVGNVETNYFYDELMYCFLCGALINLVNMDDFFSKTLPSNNKLFSVTHLIYYLFIWSNRLSKNVQIELKIIINTIFERIMLSIELFLFLLPFNVPNNLLKNNIFSWWYRFILSIPSKVINVGKLLIEENYSPNHLNFLSGTRWKLRRIYKNSPWYSFLLSFEPLICERINSESLETRGRNYHDNLLLSSTLALNLLSIHNYKKSIELIKKSSVDKNTTSIIIDGFLFYSLLEEEMNIDYSNINVIYEIEQLSNKHIKKNIFSGNTLNIKLIDILEELCYFYEDYIEDKDTEIGRSYFFVPKFYFGFMIIDYCVSIGNYHLNKLLELVGKTKGIIEEYSNDLERNYVVSIQTAFNRLLIFFKSRSLVSLTRYIMEIDILPNHGSKLKTHFYGIHNKKITNSLTQSLHFLSGLPDNIVDEDSITLIQILEQSVFSIGDGGYTNYLYLVLKYLMKIISSLFSTLEICKAIPILTLTPNEIISFSFFERELLNESLLLSSILNVELTSVVIKTFNSLNRKENFQELSKNLYHGLEYLFSTIFSRSDSFALVTHNLLPCKNFNFNYNSWLFTFENFPIKDNLGENRILIKSLEYRIWCCNICKLFKSFLSDSLFDEIMFQEFTSLEYINYLFKWLSFIEIVISYTLVNRKNSPNTNINTKLNISTITDLLIIFNNNGNSSLKSILSIVVKQELARNQSTSSIKQIMKLISPSEIYSIITNFQKKCSPIFFLSLINLSYKSINSMKYSNKRILPNEHKNLIENNILIYLTIQEQFCKLFIKHFKMSTIIWNKWCSLILNWTTVNGTILIIDYLIEIGLFDIAKLISEELLIKVIENFENICIKNELKQISIDSPFINEIKRIPEISNCAFASQINSIIINRKNEQIINLKNNTSLNKEIISKNSFESVVILFNKSSSITERYLLLEKFLTSHGTTLDITKLNVIKTITISLKIAIELEISNIPYFYFYSPYLVVRMAIMMKKKKLTKVLEREFDTVSKAEEILLMLIKESFGILEDQVGLLTQIKTSPIFGQADFYTCKEVFPIINEIGIKFDKINVSENTNIYFAISLLSILQKKIDLSIFSFNISDDISKRLYLLTQNFLMQKSIVKGEFGEISSLIWTAEEGSLKTISNNTHPFSKFIASRNQVQYKNSSIYKDKTIKLLPESQKTDINSKDKIIGFINNVSDVRILLRNLNVLLKWGFNTLAKYEFYIAQRRLTYLFEIWFKVPGILITLKDIVFPTSRVISILIFVDQSDVANSIWNNFSETKKKLKTTDPNIESKISTLISNSVIISKISQYYCFPNLGNSNFELPLSKSRNEMILEIFCNKWNIKRECLIDINGYDDNAVRIVENHILSKPDILNLRILLILLSYFSWDKLAILKENLICHKMNYPLGALFNSYNYNSGLFFLFGKVLNCDFCIRKKSINMCSISNSKWVNILINFDISDIFSQPIENLSSQYVAFVIGQIIGALKKRLYLKSDQKIRHIKKIGKDKIGLVCLTSKREILNEKKYIIYDFIGQLLKRSTPNHFLAINTFVKFNFWWEAMIYILRWSFELGNLKSRSLATFEKKQGSQAFTENIFEELYNDLVVTNSHKRNQISVLINAMNQALPLGGPRSSIVLKKCKQTIQKYLESKGALEMLYLSLLSISATGDVSHALIGAIAVHLSLINYLSFDLRTGYLESAIYHFNIASSTLRKRLKSGINKKNYKIGNMASGENSDKKLNKSSSQNSTNHLGKIKSVLIPYIADIPISKINTSPWGGMPLLTIQRITKLVEIQNIITTHLPKEDARISILSPNYKDRMDTLISLFLKHEYQIAFHASKVLKIPLLEVLVHVTRIFVSSSSMNKSLSQFLDSMKLWLPEEDSDALISNALNMWISENKINLNALTEADRKSVLELADKLSNPLNRNEAYNILQVKSI
ncbi:hypothetical protein HWI79_82 [Cryptosporidium felis]|nr:hypothetical protein HWI79_82 [Cryptosporidium felis]